MKNLINILSESNKDIDNQKLMDYINDRLSAEEKRLVEEMLVDNEFESDAFEGLKSMKNQQDIDVYVNQLHKDLKTYLVSKKNQRESRRLTLNSNTIIAIILILVLAVVAYGIIVSIRN